MLSALEEISLYLSSVKQPCLYIVSFQQPVYGRLCTPDNGWCVHVKRWQCTKRFYVALHETVGRTESFTKAKQ